MKYTKEQLLNELRKYYDEHTIAPNSRKFHIHQNTYRHHFGNWNNALALAGVPLPTATISANCLHCDKEIVFIKSKKKKFCSQSCAAKVNNKTRIRFKKPPTKQLTDYQRWKLTVGGEYCKIYNRTCKHCSSPFMSPKKYAYCPDHSDLYASPNRDRFRFHFNVFDLPELFDVNEITSIGFYDGKPQSQHKITRDHRISVTEAIKNNYSSYYITHPLNCQLMTWADNYKKRTKCSITYEELVQAVDEYEFNKIKAGVEPATSTLPK